MTTSNSNSPTTSDAPVAVEVDPSELVERIATNIRLCRRRIEWTQSDLASESDLSLKAIGEIERGNRAVSVKSLSSISAALRVEPRDLLDASTDQQSELDLALERLASIARLNSISPGVIDLCTEMLRTIAGESTQRAENGLPTAALGNGANGSRMATAAAMHAMNGNGNGHANGAHVPGTNGAASTNGGVPTANGTLAGVASEPDELESPYAPASAVMTRRPQG